MNQIIFYSSAVLAIVTTVMVILSRYPVYAVLYLIMSLFGVAMVFYTLGAPFIAVLEIIVYAGAIMVLFLFVVMMLSVRDAGPDLQRPTRRQMILPGAFALALVIIIIAAIGWGGAPGATGLIQSPKEVGIALYDKHYLGVELASLLLLIGIIGGMHLGRGVAPEEEPEVVQHGTS